MVAGAILDLQCKFGDHRDRGEYQAAAREYQRCLDTCERLGDRDGVAVSCLQLGVLALLRGYYEEAAQQYQRILDIYERLGDQDGMAVNYSQLGNLEKVRRGEIATATAWHVRALVIRLAFGAPQAASDLHRLNEYR